MLYGQAKNIAHVIAQVLCVPVSGVSQCSVLVFCDIKWGMGTDGR